MTTQVRPDPIASPRAAPEAREAGPRELPPAEATWAWSERLLPRVRQRQRALLASGPASLQRAADHHFADRGRQLRPRIALATGLSRGLRVDRLLDVAAAADLLHNASLVHDDLEDGDAMRRGREAVWTRFGAAAAINLGDWLVALAFRAAAAAPEVVGDLARAMAESAAGQALDLSARGDAGLTLDAYERIARGKSGPLLAFPVVGALRLAGASEAVLDATRRACGEIGLAYQIRDDLADLEGRKRRSAPGQDLREGKPSAPVLVFLAGAPTRVRAALRAFLADAAARRDPDRVARWVAEIQSSEAPDRARRLASAALERAFAGLACSPAARDTLRSALAVAESAASGDPAPPRSRGPSGAPRPAEEA